MRNWANLSPHDFEALVASLLDAEFGWRLKHFGRGPDGGVDLVSEEAEGHVVVQCKHYLGSSWSQLKAAAMDEKGKLEALPYPGPISYLLVTSQSLTRLRKQELHQLLAPECRSEKYILGREDLEQLLDHHPEIERSSIKLWLTNGVIAEGLLRPGQCGRNRALAEELPRRAPLFVQTGFYRRARRVLEANHVVILAGPPGVGKTTAAHMLVLDALRSDYQVVDVATIDEAWDAWRPPERQIFLHDDFLGRTFLAGLRHSGRDSKLLRFLESVTESPTTRIVLTTREYILQEALDADEALRRYGLDGDRLLLRVRDYSREERALMLYNHIARSDAIPPAGVRALVTSRYYQQIIDHPNFNPRLIEYVTGLQRAARAHVAESSDWLTYVRSGLEAPHEIWRGAYENDLSESQRGLLAVLASHGGGANFEAIEASFDSWAKTTHASRVPRRFERLCRSLEGSFIRVYGGGIYDPSIDLIDPGLEDHVGDQLVADPHELTTLMESAVYFDQIIAIWRLVDRREHLLPTNNVFYEQFVAYAARLAVFGIPQTPRLHPLLKVGTTIEQRCAWLMERPSAKVGGDAIQAVLDVMPLMIEEWRRGRGDVSAALGLVRRFKASALPRPSAAWFDALRQMIVTAPSTKDKWLAVRTFPSLVGTDWSRQEYGVMVILLEQFVASTLIHLREPWQPDEDEWYPPQDRDDAVDSIIQGGRLLQVPVPEKELLHALASGQAAARRALNERDARRRLSEREDWDWLDLDLEPVEAKMPNSEEWIDGLFASLLGAQRSHNDVGT